MAWLLLLLGEGENYGRGLMSRLSDREIHSEPSLVYRTLRGLEHAGAITSRWKDSAQGPRRRSYRLTRKGRRMLTEFAGDSAAALQLHETFLRAHEDVRGEPRDSDQVAAHARREPSSRSEGAAADDDRDGGRSGSASPDAPPATVGRDLLAGWLLLLLSQRESYGYDLRGTLEDKRIRVDPATLYRLLRTLERDGWLQSRWRRPAAGPRRRFYRVTPEGLHNLDDLAAAIAATRDGFAAFLHAHENRSDAPRPPRRRR